MIIDLILDRKAGDTYNKDVAREYIREEERIFFKGMPITKAMTEGNEANVKKALCNYVETCGYSHDICDYINSVNWLE